MPRRVLIVEDQEDLALIWAEFLRRNGHEVTLAGTVQAGLAGLHQQPDVAVVDWSLPDGPGSQLVAVATCRVLIATGHGDVVPEALRKRASAVLRKPFSLRELEQQISAT